MLFGNLAISNTEHGERANLDGERESSGFKRLNGLNGLNGLIRTVEADMMGRVNAVGVAGVMST